MSLDSKCPGRTRSGQPESPPALCLQEAIDLSTVVVRELRTSHLTFALCLALSSWEWMAVVTGAVTVITPAPSLGMGEGM